MGDQARLRTPAKWRDPYELTVRRTGDNEFIIDLESITVNGRRYAIDANSTVVGTERRPRSEPRHQQRKPVESSAAARIIGSIIGAVAGGVKGAAIGAGVGAAAGAGAQIATHGGTIDVPSKRCSRIGCRVP